MGWDLNEIREASEKKRGRQRPKGSFRFFNINMEKVRYAGNEWTWAIIGGGKGL